MTRLKYIIEQLCPDGVEYKTLGEIATISRGGSFQKKHFVNSGVPCIHYGQIYTKYSLFANTTFTFISDEVAKKQRFAQPNDIVMAVTSENIEDVCKCVVWLGDTPVAVSGHSAIIHHTQNAKYLAYYFHSSMFFTQKRKIAQGTKVIEVSPDKLNRITIPIPPLEVQAEIVRILDTFTELTTKLTTELTNRKKQYEYYRDSLLTDNNDIKSKVKTVGELSKFRRGSFPQPYGNKEWYDGEGAMPFVQVADIGDNMRLVENTKRKISILAQPKSVFAPKGSIIISLQGSIGRIAVTQYDAYIDRTVAIFSDISDCLIPKYFVYQLQRIFSIKEKTARGSTIKTITKEEFTSFPIHIPPIEEQRRIVAILDRFDKLCNDISEGLPAEIEARQKQYEYYRDKLLTFKEVE